MRTINTSQEDLLQSPKYQVWARVEIEDSTGGLINLSALSSADWVQALRWDLDLDTPVMQLTAELARDRGPSTGQSLSPLDSDSTFNVNSTAGFASLIYPGRDFNAYTRVTAAGATQPASSAMDWVFQGELDEVAWENSPMQLVARSKNMAMLMDRWIESTEKSYGSAAGVAIETVIESVITDHTTLAAGILLTTASPSFLIAPAYHQEKMRVLDAVTALTQLIGWNIQEVWSTASTSWRLKFSEPRRTATSSQKDWTFGSSAYYGVKAMSVSREDVRNKVNVVFWGSSGSTFVLVQSTSSQDKYGLRWMEFEEARNSAIDTSSEANTLGQSALDDLKEPPAMHAIELPYWYPGELGDYYEFLPNGIHYATAQYLASYGISHEISMKRQRTQVRVRGQPAGHYLQWLQYRHGGNLVFAEVLGTEITFDADAKAVVSVIGTELIAKNIYVTVGDGTTPADPTAASNHGSISGQRGVITSTVAITAGKKAVVKVVAADAAGILGPVVTVESARRDAPFHADSTDRATNSTTFGILGAAIALPVGSVGSTAAFRFEWQGALTHGGSTQNGQFIVYWSTASTSGGVDLANVLVGVAATSNSPSGVTVATIIQAMGSTRFKKTTSYFWTPQLYTGAGYAVERGEQTLDFSSATYLRVEGQAGSTLNTLTLDWTLGSYVKST